MSELTRQVGSSISALTKEFELITHNLANVNTAAYKRRANSFSKTLEKQMSPAGSQDSGQLSVKSAIDFTQGTLKETGRAMDIALNGSGFFVLETPQGPVYTRNGSFQINRNGQLVDSAGRLVQGRNGPLDIPVGTSVSQITVAVDGTIQAADQRVGQLRVVDFGDDTESLKPIDNGCFAMPNPQIDPEDAQDFTVKQGYQEASNVKMVEERVDMIMVSRLYEANLKFMTGTKDASRSLMQVAMG